ncbi:ATP-binding protein [Streptomyces murinus]|uniref:ATP-binding protein n=1 Tax=Streptomyces murinus TaxID=33900 RepID=UPI0037FA6DC9
MNTATAVAPVAAGALPRAVLAFEVAFTPSKARVAQMRRITHAHMALWGLPSTLADDVVLAVSELVTNAVRYGRGNVRLWVRCAEELRIEVRDGNPAPALVRTTTDQDESGRGLLLVAGLARKWGVSQDGRTTWAVFCLPAGGL